MTAQAPTKRIAPQDFLVLNDRFVIRTRVAKDDISDDDIMIRVSNANLTVGDTITVQCVTHEKGILLHEAEYVVYGRSQERKRVQVNDREDRQFNEVKFLIARKTEWWASPAAQEAERNANLQKPTDAPRKGREAA